jgi:hypothetical protein
MSMVRFAWLAFAALVACTSAPQESASPQHGYAGTVEKVLRVVRQGPKLPGTELFGKLGSALGAAFRQNVETLQYIVRTPSGQITAQTDEEFAPGDCVEVIPQTGRSGPAFRYGEARVVRSQRCSG